MGKTNLSSGEYQKLAECFNSQTDVPEGLLVKLSPAFFEKLRQAGKFDYKELDKYKIPTIEYAGTSLVTMAFAPIIAPSPMRTPGIMVASYPIHTSLPTTVSPL